MARREEYRQQTGRYGGRRRSENKSGWVSGLVRDREDGRKKGRGVPGSSGDAREEVKKEDGRKKERSTRKQW